jgi:hypothetical protein
VLNVNCFAPPAAFTIGNAGRNIVTGPGLIYSQASARRISPSRNAGTPAPFDFRIPSTIGASIIRQSGGLQNPQLFGKITD